MKWKSMIILILTVFVLFSMASVCAGDVNDAPINSGNTSQMDLSKSNAPLTAADDKILQTDVSAEPQSSLGLENDNILKAGNYIEINDLNYSDYFDDDGNILDNGKINYDDQIKLGNINNKTFKITKTLTISSETTLNNVAFIFSAGSYGSVISNLTINNSGDLTPITVDNVEFITISSTTIVVESLKDSGEVYAINAYDSSELKIVDNNIIYVGKTNGTNANNAVHILNSYKTTFERNTLNINVPSVSEYLTAGIVMEGDDSNFNNNTINLKAENIIGDNDEVHVVHFECYGTTIGGNVINASGESTIYGISIEGYYYEMFNNEITLYGNTTKGIISTAYDVEIDQATINSTGRESVAIEIICGNANITSSNLISNGRYAVDFNGEGQVTDNEICAELLTGDFAVKYNGDSNVLVTGNTPEMQLDYTVTNDTFIVYFDEEGKIRKQIRTDKLTFLGPLSNLLNEIIIDQPMTLLGDSAEFYEMGIVIASDNIVVDGFDFKSKTLSETIQIQQSNNVSIKNSNFTVTGVDTDTRIIHIICSNDVSIDNVDIYFTAKTDGTYYNVAIFAEDCDGLFISNAYIDAKLPPRAINWYLEKDYSEVIFLDGCDNAVLNNNTIHAYSEGAPITDYDTIYGVIVIGNNASIFNNEICVFDAPIGYSFFINGENFNISKSNEFKVIGNGIIAYGIEVEGSASGVIDGNLIHAGGDTAYGICISNWAGGVKLNITHNIIDSKGNIAYGMDLRCDEVFVWKNQIGFTDSNFTVGILSDVDNITINNNEILSNGSNIGTPSGNIETVGIHILTGNANVTDNKIYTTGENCVNIADDVNGCVTENELVANAYTGDASVNYAPRQLTVKNNTPKMEKINICADNIEAFYDENIAAHVNVTDYDGYNFIEDILIELRIGKDNYTNRTDENGSATFDLGKFGVGNYSFTLTTITDPIYVQATKTVNITVSKANSTVNLSDITLDYGNSINVTVKTQGTVNITAKIDDEKATVNGSTITIPILNTGTYNLTVTTVPDENHTEATKTVKITVNRVNSSANVSDATLNYGDSVNITATTHGAIGITAKIDDGSVDVEEYSIPISGLNAGNHTLTVTTIPDGNHNPVTVTATVTVDKTNSTVYIDDVEMNYGCSTSVNVTTEGALGITAKLNGEEIIFSGNSIPIPVLEVGTYSLTVTTIPDENHNPVTKTVTVTVLKQNTTLDLEMPTNITVDENSTVNIKLPDDATGNVTVKVDGEAVDTVPVTNGSADLTIPSLKAGNHTVEITYSGDVKYDPVTETKEVSVSKHDTAPEIAVDDETVNVKLPSDATGNVTVKVDDTVVSTVPVTDGTASVKLPKLSAGNHTVEIAYSGDDKYKSASKTATISVDKDSTMLAANNVTATYKVKKYLTITLTDSSGSSIVNATVSVELKSAKNYTTDENGQVKVKVSSLVPKTYTAKIAFNGDDNYAGSDTTAKVVVKKAASKITAKAKTFKTTTKTKKYTVTLKANGKALKNKWVYLKVNGVKYKAKTNSKGKATFNLKKLAKTGTAKVTYKGNDYYKKATKNVKLTVKSVFKTISKGSKNHEIVKKIQRALKNHGYYLVYNGHYLKVDGIFWDYTEMAVKEFQNDKKLKVTGKVDEKTAKKLRIF